MILASLSRRKTLGMPENTGFTGSVVADWLQKCVINLLSEWFEYVDRNAAEESAAFVMLILKQL